MSKFPSMVRPEFSDDGDIHEDPYLILNCPHCGSENMHHTVVRVLNRGEDCPGRVTLVSPTEEQARVGQLPPACIPGRRDCLEIDFYCELCPSESTLQIRQHKGDTMLMWVTGKDRLNGQPWEDM